MSADPGPSLTTAQLAERAGMSAGTLRMWEARYGFPTPQRLPGGHHRYSPRDVEMLQEVLRLREHGLSIPAAIARAAATGRGRASSIFAGLRELRTDLQPVTIKKRALLQVTRAIEDEYCARAAAGLLVASFQRVTYYEQSRRRWVELARTAEVACALADFDALSLPDDGPIEVPVARADPLSREWTLVVDAPGAQACLAAWEPPSVAPQPEPERRFEMIWSFEPEVVRTARTIACELIAGLAPAAAERLPPPPAEPVTASQPELRFATGLAQRMVGYLAVR
ncbi:MAG TPA: DICT sensory domain-containing protein [Solirubrobacteraceae bacterium]|jgi:DNA-binding transcriptional MerR regulator|nr:DICT sensory domain-containing protein [Solirubrobacteraceae bacterium]